MFGSPVLSDKKLGPWEGELFDGKALSEPDSDVVDSLGVGQCGGAVGMKGFNLSVTEGTIVAPFC